MRLLQNPTYLPNIPNATEQSKPINIPSFDNVVAKRPLRVVSLPGPVQLPRRVTRTNPRDLMHTHNRGLSDHIPVLAMVEDTNRKIRVRIATFNVADPHYWSRFYEGADAGFREEEHSRQGRVFNAVSTLLSMGLEILCLQEVPYPLLTPLEKLASQGNLTFHMVRRSEGGAQRPTSLQIVINI